MSDLLATAEQGSERTLECIRSETELKAEGALNVQYRLTNGRSCTYGCNPKTGQIECYFSTQDDSTLELTLTNCSDFDLKHVRVTDIELKTEDGGVPNDGRRLPDGNAYIEIVPSEAYFGTLPSAGGEATRQFAIITRGTAPGNYFICLDFDYDIDACTSEIKLGLTVNGD